jgi:hypothetical protein
MARREPIATAGVHHDVRGSAIGWLLVTITAAVTVAVALAAPAAARADAIWCGTFDDQRRPPRDAWTPPRSPPPSPAVRVRVERVLVDGVSDRRAGLRIDAELALERCLDAGDVGRGATWDLDLAVSADGTVIDARVRGAPRGMDCVIGRARSIRFGRGTQLRAMSARVIASAAAGGPATARGNGRGAVP